MQYKLDLSPLRPLNLDTNGDIQDFLRKNTWVDPGLLAKEMGELICRQEGRNLGEQLNRIEEETGSTRWKGRTVKVVVADGDKKDRDIVNFRLQKVITYVNYLRPSLGKEEEIRWDAITADAFMRYVVGILAEREQKEGTGFYWDSNGLRKESLENLVKQAFARIEAKPSAAWLMYKQRFDKYRDPSYTPGDVLQLGKGVEMLKNWGFSIMQPTSYNLPLPPFVRRMARITSQGKQQLSVPQLTINLPSLDCLNLNNPVYIATVNTYPDPGYGATEKQTSRNVISVHKITDPDQVSLYAGGWIIESYPLFNLFYTGKNPRVYLVDLEVNEGRVPASSFKQGWMGVCTDPKNPLIQAVNALEKRISADLPDLEESARYGGPYVICNGSMWPGKWTAISKVPAANSQKLIISYDNEKVESKFLPNTSATG